MKIASVEMGNGSSQSIVLGPPKPLGFPVRGDMRYQRGKPKYAQPHNRVLPKPVAGQRLRCTDNGNILHNIGTIRGLKHTSCGIRDDNEDVDPEMMEILRKRSELTEKEQTCYHQFNLRNHRLFHSDPDIARSRPTSYSPEGITPGGQRRSGGGVAVRASKLRYRKKSKAPEPPSGNSLPRQFERMSQPTNSEIRSASQERKGLCRCVNNTPDWKPKTRAPPPPHNSAGDTPPPPPPLPSSPTSHAVGGISQENSVTRTTHGGPSVTRITDAAQSRILGYEKNIHPLSKWRNNRSAGDLRIEEECTAESRTTVFDSKSHLNGSEMKKSALLTCEPDAFQKEIVAVTKKIAENRQQSENKSSSKISPPRSSCPESSSPKQYYFCDAGAFKSSSPNKASSSVADESTWSTPEPNSPSRKLCTADVTVHSPADVSLTREKPKTPEKVTSPPESTEKFPSDVSPTASLNRKRRAEWEALHESLIQKNEDGSDIDIRLRPVLPRKTISIPKFSPAEAWQALGSDGGGPGSSNQSTSEADEALEPIRRCNLPTAPRRSPGVIYAEKHPMNRKFKTTTCDTYHWTPRQDLADDSDASSVNSEDAVVPRNRDCNSNDIPMRFSLPTVMFSNLRPIGTELPSNKVIGNNRFSEDSEAVPLKSGCKKKYQTSSPDVRTEGNTSTNFKKFLGIRNKFLSEEDISASDSNWTFGKYALLKKGKQYSSDLMLSNDKKRYELTAAHSPGELLGDILMSKSHDVQKRLRYIEPSNGNFSFYSTEGHVMYLPSGDEHSLSRHDNDEVPSPPTKGRVYHTRRVVENRESHHHQVKPHPKGKKKLDLAEREIDRKRNLELVRMLEEEVRKRRNKEKINIRQQLQMMKRLSNVDDDDDEDEFDDEAYFTEPKSRDGGYSPQGIDIVGQKRFLSQDRRAHQGNDSGPLSQWKSSPALLEESIRRGPRRTVRDSSSSITSSPDLVDLKYNHRTVAVDSWSARQQKPGLGRKKCDNANDVERSSSDDLGIVSDRPSPSSGVEEGRIKGVPHSERRERKTTSIYKQLMDIVRREERQMNKACGDGEERISRDSSSSSQHASSLSATSSASSSSSYSCSDSVDHKIVRSSSTSKSGIPANDEFHHTSLGVESPANRGRCPRSDVSAKSPFQVALVQPFSPSSKGYRPVPFDVVVSGSAGCKNSGFQEGRQVSSQVS